MSIDGPGRGRMRVAWAAAVASAWAAIGLSESVASAAGLQAGAADERIDAVDHPPGDQRNPLYYGNREPLAATPLVELPIGAVQPHGWLRKQLELQAAGFHGHLGEISEFLLKPGNAWLDTGGEGDHGWEEVPYWLKGFLLTAYLIGDEAQIEEAHRWIEGALSSAQPDGWFGPISARSTVESTRGQYDLWPNMVMLYCLQAYYDRTSDERVIVLMQKYFRWQLAIPDADFLPPYWQQQRAADNLSSVYWLYNRTADPWLLELAEKIHRHTANWTDGIPDWHNVNFSQAFGGPARFFVQAGDEKYLAAAYRNYDEVRTRYGQVPGGMFGGDENCREGFFDPRQAIEACGMVELMLSTEVLANLTGDTVWADRCEDVAFNSLPAALTADFKALRYLTAPNHVLSDRASKSPGLQNGGPMYLMDPTGHRCCQHNFGHGWPYFVAHLWSATSDRGLAAVLYGPARVEGGVGDGGEVALEVDTHYPFDERIALSLSADRPVRFPLYLRVPHWCRGPQLAINGAAVAVSAHPGEFIRIDRTWKTGDRVELTLPMEITARVWAANQNSVSIDRGPLTYSLKIGERYEAVATRLADWPALEIHPTTPWNYGLEVDPSDPAASFQVETRPWPASEMPFTLEGSPLVLKGKARRIPQWQLDELGLVGLLQPSPVRSGEPSEAIELVPMGAARLRLTAFPVIARDGEGHVWQAPPQPLYRASASHCFERDSVRALCDQVLPGRSSDQALPRMTWWPRQGTSEWVQYDFEKPRVVRQVRVYWFDDTGSGGGCALPLSWRLLYRDAAGAWQAAAAELAEDVAADRFDVRSIRPVATDALRLEVQLREQRSAGILEWEVEFERDEFP